MTDLGQSDLDEGAQGRQSDRVEALVVVHPDQASFDAWSKEGVAPAETLVDVGRRVFDEAGCLGCHSIDGEPGVGPTVKGLWGKTEKLAGGGTVVVDENYVRESILQPSAKIAHGYDDLMPPTPLEERDLLGVIEYLKSLKEAP